jgi:IclR family transcriptional regulator, acetate operon repressor
VKMTVAKGSAVERGRGRMRGSTAGRYSVRAVRRALDVLFSFSRFGPSLSNAEIATHLGLDPSTVFRLLSCLQDAGLVVSNPVDRRYQLGPAVVELDDAWRRNFDFRAAAQPLLRRLWRETQETVGLSALAGRSRVYVDRIESPHVVRTSAELGILLPLHAGGPGKVLLAYADESLRRAVLRGPLPPVAPRTQTDPGRLKSHLGKIRRAGYAVSVEELAAGSASVAAPIFGPKGRLLGAISVSLPGHRFTRDRQRFLVDRVVATAAEITRLTFGKPQRQQSPDEGSGGSEVPVTKKTRAASSGT